MLDVRRMRVLREVAVRGSFSAAAEALSFTQSAVSQQIAALEREAGAVLVERNARGVRLTEAGEALVRHTDAILARLAEAEAELESIAGLKGGRLRIAAFESAASSLMPFAIARFRERHPGVELTLALLEPEQALPQLRSGELDLALVFSSGPPRDAGDIEFRHLLDDPLYLALPATHPLADKRALRLADVAGDPWLAGPGDCECNRLINRACAVAGFDPRIVFETADYTAMQGFIAAGVGVSLIAELGLTMVRDGVVVRSLGHETPVRQVHAAVTAGGYRSPAARAMLDVLDEAAEEYAARRPPRLELVGSAAPQPA
jgi:molybdate transport repressor ModE-like protein